MFATGPAVAVGALCVLGVNLYAAALIVLRARRYRTPLYKPMLLNIALSNVPIVLAVLGLVVVLLAQIPVIEDASLSWVGPTAFAATAVVFVAFFPNSAYLITELNFSHRKEGDGVPMWFDIVMTLTLTMSGILNAIVSLSLVQTFLMFGFDVRQEFPLAPPPWTWAVAAGVLLLACIGVWMGRMIRLNSWDIVLPWRIVVKMVRHLRQPGKVRELLGFTVAHWVLLALLYVAVYAPVSMLVLSELRLGTAVR
ncbi:DUF1361 domain-containing protein [Serinibacter arcticus]|uniref:DUF1361 domain-containing protein n=1 Tax=Serinibacter arcticus TaxID=1655435 RepID=A0A2U2A092_9MICO|nr:DUF1361 domain-containing protein [Serinibacter arcticus]PWD52648.1 DUF1361 domain-containing protein [Serinibacter arcticus]